MLLFFTVPNGPLEIVRSKPETGSPKSKWSCQRRRFFCSSSQCRRRTVCVFSDGTQHARSNAVTWFPFVLFRPGALFHDRTRGLIKQSGRARGGCDGHHVLQPDVRRVLGEMCGRRGCDLMRHGLCLSAGSHDLGQQLRLLLHRQIPDADGNRDSGSRPNESARRHQCYGSRMWWMPYVRRRRCLFRPRQNAAVRHQRRVVSAASLDSRW